MKASSTFIHGWKYEVLSSKDGSKSYSKSYFHPRMKVYFTFIQGWNIVSSLSDPLGPPAKPRYGVSPLQRLFYHTTQTCDVWIRLASFKVYKLDIANSFFGKSLSPDSQPSYCSCCNHSRVRTSMLIMKGYKQNRHSRMGSLYVFRAEIIFTECPMYVFVCTCLYMVLPPHVRSYQKLARSSHWHQTTPHYHEYSHPHWIDVLQSKERWNLILFY
jgi:hypothetical protein